MPIKQNLNGKKGLWYLVLILYLQYQVPCTFCPNKAMHELCIIALIAKVIDNKLHPTIEKVSQFLVSKHIVG